MSDAQAQQKFNKFKKNRPFKQRKQEVKQKQAVQKGTGVFVNFDLVPKDLTEEAYDELVATLPKTRKKKHPDHDLGTVQAINLSEVHDLADEEGLEASTRATAVTRSGSSPRTGCSATTSSTSRVSSSSRRRRCAGCARARTTTPRRRTTSSFPRSFREQCGPKRNAHPAIELRPRPRRAGVRRGPRGRCGRHPSDLALTNRTFHG
jgi:hypothetical protein